MFIELEKEFIMTLDKTVKYAGRFGDKDTNSPTGSYKNKSDSSTNDGSFLEQDWANDAYDGLSGAFLANVHDASTNEPQGYTEPTFPVTINNLVDNAQASQVYNAWYKKTNDIVDAKIAELITLSEGCWFNYYSGGSEENSNQGFTASNALLDFYLQNNGSDIYEVNSNNISFENSNTIKIAKAGTYFMKMIFSLSTTNDAQTVSITPQISTDNVSYTSLYTIDKARNLFEYQIISSTSTQIIGRAQLFNTYDRSFAISGTAFTPVFYLVIPNDDTYLQFDMEFLDSQTFKYNFDLLLQRVGKPITNYTPPADYVTGA